ncbi:hypothetical protein F1C76_01120 [Geodermatophilaceae bacterium NBWT11]|nr:hypothetical protein F1C76_01120 [Geodermatophilaceae bacterium NBWT11]
MWGPSAFGEPPRVRQAGAGEKASRSDEHVRRHTVKKIVLASAAMGGAALVAFGASGTFAAFSDQESSVLPEASAGTLYLNAAGQSASSDGDVSQIVPTQTVTFATPVQNAGNLDGILKGTLVLQGNEENSCVGPEIGADTSCAGTGAGELAGQLQATSGYRVLAAGETCDEDTPTIDTTFRGTLLQLVSAGSGLAPIAAGTTVCSVITVTLPELGATNNLVQSDSIQLRFDFELTQDTSV